MLICCPVLPSSQDLPHKHMENMPDQQPAYTSSSDHVAVGSAKDPTEHTTIPAVMGSKDEQQDAGACAAVSAGASAATQAAQHSICRPSKPGGHWPVLRTHMVQMWTGQI